MLGSQAESLESLALIRTCSCVAFYRGPYLSSIPHEPLLFLTCVLSMQLSHFEFGAGHLHDLCMLALRFVLRVSRPLLLFRMSCRRSKVTFLFVR